MTFIADAIGESFVRFTIAAMAAAGLACFALGFGLGWLVFA